MSSSKSTLRKAGWWLLELLLIAIVERLLGPVIDLGSSLIASQTPSTTSVVLGSIGIIAIIAATALGMLLLQRLLKWVKAANQAMRRTGVTIPEPRKLESTQPASPSGLEVYTRAEVERRFPFESFVSQVKHGGELAIMTAVFTEGRHDVDTIKRLITEKNVTVTILLLAPTIMKTVRTFVPTIAKMVDGRTDVIPEIERDFGWKGLAVEIQQTLNELCELRRDLKDLRSRLIIRTYDRTPTLSMIAIDPSTEEDGIMQVGTYLSGTDAGARFQIILHKKDMKNVFKKYWAEYELVYKKHSKEINYKQIESEFLS